MSKLMLILFTTIVSTVVAAPNLGQWHEKPNQPGFVSYSNQPQINWNQYVNEGNNGVLSYPDKSQSYWNKYPIDGHTGYPNYPHQPQQQWDKYSNEGNGLLPPYPQESQQWNKYPDEENSYSPVYPQQQWHQYPNGGNVNQPGHGHGAAPNDNKISDCGPSLAYEDVPGMQFWCRANCFHIPSFCPSSHCQCW